RTFFTLAQNGMKLFDFTLKVPGRHNALNAAAGAIACKQLGLSWEQIAKGLLKFGGTKRRFEQVGRIGDIRIVDDYAHHPTEIKAQLAGLREWFPKNRIVVVFQPHTYSRTKALMNEFAHAFQNAQMVLLTDIYSSARETDTLGITGKTLVEETAKHHSNVFFAPDFSAVNKLLRQHMQSNDVILFMGAGDIYGWSKRFIEK
ncbi:MAG: UDP-N-acetylmuramate--L-alanine ligase, partial [Candidatus Gottesmanbacteria bacterium]|nr:UDP-N-acetylmuramate--L-alanine ligase [Candidatus Gottesmanbacteria bacterium]